ncbi:hypothetical protein FQN54_001327 [Arachnomyces sp. PD_36]|nr:hypothetical protein FQN54_001327 [Arachnomyces sp. PD_36]
MATNLASPPGQFSVYGHPSPINSASPTPANNSPTSPRATTTTTTSNTSNTSNPHQLPLQSRQLRPPKSPLYVPAALRPTERAVRPSPPTPPRSVHGSLDSLVVGDPNPISRRSTADSKNEISRRAEDEWMKDEHLGLVTGLPTREHWKADSASPSCDSPTCRTSFGIFLRRHHCRHCGHVFCSSHTPHTVPLDQNARFHPDGVESRACELCWRAFKRWDETRSDRLDKIEREIMEESNTPSGASTPSLPMRASEAHHIAIDSQSDFSPMNQQSDLAASSVPRDWNWSTF